MSDGAVLQARLVGALFVERGLLTAEQLERALELQAERGELIGEILVSEFDISRVELASVLAEQWAELEKREEEEVSGTSDDGGDSSRNGTAAVRRRIGEIFVERGFATQEDIEAALAEQQASGKPLGEVLIERGSLSRLDLASALAEQWSNLEKLRPPAPKRVEGWQQVAPAEHAAAVAQGAARPSDEDVPEPTGGQATYDTSLADELAVLAQRVADVEALRVEAVDGADEIARLHAGLDELRERVTHPEARLGEIEGRVGALEAGRTETHDVATRDELEKVAGALAQRLDGMRARLDEAVAGANHGIEAMLETVVELQQRIDAAGVTGGAAAGEQSELDALRARLDELARDGKPFDAIEERISALEARGGETPWRDELASVQARLDELAAGSASLDVVERRLAAVAQTDAPSRDEVAALRARLEEVASASAAIDALRVRIAALESAPDAAAWQDEAAGLRARLDELAGTASAVDGLSLRVEEIDERSVSAPWRDDIAGLRARLDELAGTASAVDGLSLRVEEIDERSVSAPWRDDIAGLRARLDELAATASAVDGLSLRVEEIDERSSSAPWRDDIAGLRARLDELAGEQAPLDALTEKIASFEAAVGERPWRKDVRRLGEDIGSRLEALTGELAKTPWRDELESVRAELAAIASTPGLDARVATLESLAADMPWRKELGPVQERLGELADAHAAVDGLRERLSAVERRDETEALRAEVAGVRDEVARIASVVSSVEGLEGRLATVEEAAVGRPSAKDLRKLSEQVAEQVRGLSTRLDEARDASRASALALEARLSAVAEELGSGEAGWAHADHEHPEIATLGGRVDRLAAAVEAADQLSARLAAVEDVATTRPWRDELSHATEELRARVQDVAARLDERDASEDHAVHELRMHLSALSERLDGLTASTWAPADHSHAEVEELRAGLDRVGEVARTADALRERLEAMERLSAATPKREEVAGLYARLDELGKTIGDERLTAVRAEVEELRGHAARIEAGSHSGLESLGARLDELGGVVAGLVAANDVESSFAERSELERVERVLREIGELTREAARTASSTESLVGERLASEAAARTSLESDLRQQLEAVSGQAREEVMSVGSRLDALAAEAGTRLDGLTEAVSGMAALSQAVEALASDTRAADAIEHVLRETEGRLDARIATHDEAIAVLRSRVEQVASLDSVLSDRVTAAAAALGGRIDEIAAQTADERALSAVALDALAANVDALDQRVGGLSAVSAESVDGLGARVDALAAMQSEQSASGAAAVEGLTERLGFVELQTRSIPDTLQELGTRLGDQVSRIEAVEAAAASALRASSGWTDAATALGSRLIAVEEALAAAAGVSVEPRLADMEQRLHAEAAQADVRAQATEEALRDGLATLAMRLAERESAFAEAGDALRRSVEGLGRALVRTDDHLAGRDERESGTPRHADAYVAFAPTGDGYRLIAVDAPAPGIGETVVLDGHESALLVTRIGVSPIPLDDRPCAYLEPAMPAAAGA